MEREGERRKDDLCFTLLLGPAQRRFPIPRGTPSAGAQSTRGGTILRFSTEISVYLKNGPRLLWLLWNVNRKSYALYRMVTFSMTLTDPNPIFKVTELTLDRYIKVAIFFDIEYLRNDTR